MRRQKRESRALRQGFISGIRGRSDEDCPYKSSMDKRGQWFSGWRKGRESFLKGFLDNDSISA